jgi:hypothetical protein
MRHPNQRPRAAHHRRGQPFFGLIFRVKTLIRDGFFRLNLNSG